MFEAIKTKSNNHVSPTLISIKKITDIKDEPFGPILHVLKYSSSESHELINQINNYFHECFFEHHHVLFCQTDCLDLFFVDFFAKSTPIKKI